MDVDSLLFTTETYCLVALASHPYMLQLNDIKQIMLFPVCRFATPCLFLSPCRLGGTQIAVVPLSTGSNFVRPLSLSYQMDGTSRR